MTSRPHDLLSSTASGRTGLELARRDLPDIVLLDLHLGDIHGLEVLDALKAEPATAAIPVVILSADASPEVIRDSLGRGALAYLTKPIDLTQLSELLDATTSSTRRWPAETAARPGPK